MRPQPALVEVLNDLNGDLMTLYRVVQNHHQEFVRQFKWGLSSRQIFEWQKMTCPETLTDIQRAARFFYLQHAFGGKVTGQMFGTATTGPATTCCASRRTSTSPRNHKCTRSRRVPMMASSGLVRIDTYRPLISSRTGMS
ncbi:Type II, N-methyl DNA methyltransferase (group alpha) [Pseudomonas chlororaphis subsp. aurantiaca]|nr:Type II, N-methyl DNA methyltransferase (group alpha) [Pseudomonas chlororaphis subsp. aurantiaca]AZE22544.1 Type II, N-methyl DNA methyltransferase (group alpha) [Pseudomonas chlororaphis subsp. aureofaciens]